MGILKKITKALGKIDPVAKATHKVVAKTDPVAKKLLGGSSKATSTAGGRGPQTQAMPSQRATGVAGPAGGRSGVGRQQKVTRPGVPVQKFNRK